jgi:hypothetical protein
MDSPNTNTNLFELQIDPSSQMYLRETAKWAKFLAIVGFVMCAFIALLGIFFGSFIAAISARFAPATPAPPEATTAAGVMGGIIYFFIAVVYFFPCLFLLRFSNQMQVALRSNMQENLTSSFRNLKACYKYVGILTIILVSIYLMIFLFFGLGMMAGGMAK